MPSEQGYFVLADISGFTAYLAGAELEHAHDILADLLETVVFKLRLALTISKLEGDAVFAYAPAAKLERGETLLEAVETTYAAFRDRREAVRRVTTCQCNACRNIPRLDLKFIVHYGVYIMQDVAGTHELVGSDVNLAHRLMKNHVAEATGWQAYALLSEPCLARVGLQPAGLHEQVETYEHLPPVKTYSFDLQAGYQAMLAQRRALITLAQADLVIVQDLPAPVTVVWDWINNPQKRVQWDELDEVVPVLRPAGRASAGARNHCVHGKDVAVEDVLDWRPFDYFTVRIVKRGIGVTRTCAFQPLAEGGTRLSTAFAMALPGPRPLTRPIARAFLQAIGMRRTREHMARLVTAEAEGRLDPAARPFG